MKELQALLNDLLESKYYSRGYLNSEGRKVFERIARIILSTHPELKPLINKIRKNPSLENIVKFTQRLEELIENMVYEA